MVRRNPGRDAKTAAAKAIRATGSNARGRGGRRNTGRPNVQPVDPPVDENTANDNNGGAITQPPAQTQPDQPAQTLVEPPPDVPPNPPNDANGDAITQSPTHNLPNQPAEPPVELPADPAPQAPTQIQPNDNTDQQPHQTQLAPQQAVRRSPRQYHGGNHHAPGQAYIRDDGVHIGADGRPVRMDPLGRPSIIPHNVANGNPPSSSSSEDLEEDPDTQPPQEEIRRPPPEGARQGILDGGVPPHDARRPRHRGEEPDSEEEAAQGGDRRRRKLPVLERRLEPSPDLRERARDERAVYEQKLTDLNDEVDRRRHDIGDEGATFPDLDLQADDAHERYDMERTAIRAEDERRMTEWRQYTLRWNARERRRRRVNRRQDLIRPLSFRHDDILPLPPSPQMPAPRPSVGRSMRDLIDRANRRAEYHPLNPGDLRVRNQTLYPHGPRYGPHTARLMNDGVKFFRRPRTPVRSPRVRGSPLNSPDERSRTREWLRDHPEEYYISPITRAIDIHEPNEEPVEEDGPREPANEPERRGLKRMVRIQEQRERAQELLDRAGAAPAAMTQRSPRRSPRGRVSQNVRSHPYSRSPIPDPPRHSPPPARVVTRYLDHDRDCWVEREGPPQVYHHPPVRNPENYQSDRPRVAQQRWNEENELMQLSQNPRRHPSRPSNVHEQENYHRPGPVRPGSRRGQPHEQRRPSRPGVISPDRITTKLIRNENQTIRGGPRRSHAENENTAHQPGEEPAELYANTARITAGDMENRAEAGRRAQAIAQASLEHATRTVDERQRRRLSPTTDRALERERRRLAESTARLRDEVQQRRLNIRQGGAPLREEEGDADGLRDYEYYYPPTEQERQPVNRSNPHHRPSTCTGATPSHIPVLDPETREPMVSERAPSRQMHYYDVVGRPPSQGQGPHGERRRRRRSSMRDPTSRDPLKRVFPRVRPSIEHPPEDKEISPRNTTHTRRGDRGGRQRVRFSDPLRDDDEEAPPPPLPSRGQTGVRIVAAYDENDNIVGWYKTTSPLPLGANLAEYEIEGRPDDGGHDESRIPARDVSGRQRRYPRTPAEAEAEQQGDDYDDDDQEVRSGDIGARPPSGLRGRSENEAAFLEGIGDEDEDGKMWNLFHEDRDDPGDDWVIELDYD